MFVFQMRERCRLAEVVTALPILAIFGLAREITILTCNRGL
jgi:hypothetical protein